MLKKLYEVILATIFPTTAREDTIRKLANGELELRLAPRNGCTAAGVKVTSLTEYDGRVRKLVHSLKFYNSHAAAHILARVLHDYLAEYLADKELYGETQIMIAPVPLARARLRARGFNQVERILRELIAIDPSFKKVVHTDLLIRTRNTVAQTKLKRKERLDNLKNAFQVKQERDVCAAHIIVVDDVVTTGATLSEVKRTLESAGCRNVTLIALARA